MNSITVVRREREARKETVRDRLRESQRQTLLELQDALNVLMRAEFKLHHHDLRSFAQQGRRTDYSEDLNQNAMEAQSLTAKLASRVRNKEVRDKMVALKTQTNVAIIFSKTAAEADAAMQVAMPMAAELMELLGEKIRTIDDEEMSA